MSLLLFQPWLIVHVVCLYIQVIILCCNGSISAVSWLNIHELWIFCDLVLQHVTCHGLMGFETITHFVKNPKPGYFYSMLEFTVDLTLYSWLYHIAEDQSQPCWSKIWWIMDCYHDLVLYRVILWQCWEVCTALWILTVFSLRQHDLSSHQFINWVSSDLIQQIFNPCACAVLSKLAMEKR